MIALETYIPTRISTLVKSFWCIKVTGDGDPYHEDILPDGHHEIIFHLSAGNARRNSDNNNWFTEPASFFAGQTLRSYSLELDSPSVLYGIRFHPHTLHTLFGFPAGITTDRLLPLYEIPGAKMLESCISEDVSDTFRKFEKVLIQLCSRADLSANKFQYIDYAVNQVLVNKGNTRISELVRKTGISQRYFDTLFHQSVGITPKTFCNIIRLNHFISYRKNYLHKNLTDCCHEAGFFDQSHLINLFRSVTGQSPKAFFKSPNQISNYFSDI